MDSHAVASLTEGLVPSRADRATGQRSTSDLASSAARPNHGILGLQRAAGNAAVVQRLEEETSPVHGVVGSGGRPLEPQVRTEMEARLGADFADVRIHDDAAAAASASAVNAHAYTVGSDVVFQRDLYDPSSHAGRVTLAHELTHVVQQRSGPVDGTAAPGGIKISDPADRFEREAADNAERVMRLDLPSVAPAPDVSPVQRPLVGDEHLQASSVQRDLSTDEELEEDAPGGE